MRNGVVKIADFGLSSFYYGNAPIDRPQLMRGNLMQYSLLTDFTLVDPFIQEIQITLDSRMIRSRISKERKMFILLASLLWIFLLDTLQSIITLTVCIILKIPYSMLIHM